MFAVKNSNCCDDEKRQKRRARITELVSNIAITLMLVSLCLIGFTQSGGYTAVFSKGKQNAPIYKGSQEGARVSLMINVYWGDEYLPSMLDTLKAYGAKCTFFVGGSWADDNNQLLLRMIEEGHEIGNHGYFHKDHKSLDYSKNRQEIVACNDVVKAITGKSPTLFAPPSGSFSDTTLQVCEALSMKVIMWSRDTIDWRDKNTDTIIKRATENIEAGDMILMHPTYNTAEALPTILKYYKEHGFTAVTVSDIISDHA